MNTTNRKTDAQESTWFGSAISRSTWWRASAISFVLSLTLVGNSQAYTVVQTSTSAPRGLETSFIAATTNQFLSTLFVNPLFAGTYQLTLLGVNPNYNPPPTTLEQSLSLGATVYVYGFVDGMTYQQHVEEKSVGFEGSLCSAATNFNLVNTTTATFDTNTCLDMISTIEDQLYEMSLSTPTPIPPTGI